MKTLIPIFHGWVTDDGRLELLDNERDRRRRYLATLAGRPVEVVVRKVREQRSIDQNKYWWAVPIPLLAEHCGYTDTQMHYVLLGECFGYVVGPTGKGVPNVASSSNLSVEEFTKLIDWVLIWGPTEMGVYIPPPKNAEAA